MILIRLCLIANPSNIINIGWNEDGGIMGVAGVRGGWTEGERGDNSSASDVIR